MTRHWCERCMRVHESGEPCPKAPQRKSPRPDTRHGRDPSRSSYGKADYQRNRQRALQLTHGRCARCGRVIARKEHGQWRTEGGGTHHIVPLRRGGTNDLRNLVPLCDRCHAQADAEERRRDGLA